MYGSDTTYGLTTDIDGNYNISHSTIIANLELNKIYHFKIVSEDAIGNLSLTPDNTFSIGISDDINVYPIPYIEGETIMNHGITFQNLPGSSSIKIYNLLGEMIYTIRDRMYSFTWNLKNANNRKVQSGVYIYTILDKNNKKIKSDKIIIVR